MKIWHIILITQFLLQAPVRAQHLNAESHLTLKEAFALAIKNSVQLKISMFSVEIAKEQTEIVKLNHLPNINTGINYGYLSNSEIWNPSFSEHRTVEFPHNFAQFTLQASEVVFKGGLFKNSIQKSVLEEQIADLRFQKNTDDIKFMVTAKYLDIYRTINQRKVFINNTKLSKQRLENILSMQKQGMVTRNDVLRMELIISNLEISTLKANNNIDILNQQLNIILGLESSTRLNPDPMLLDLPDQPKTVTQFLEEANKKNYELQLVALDKKIAHTNLKIIGSERFPEISLYAGSNLQRPYLFSMPAVDFYFNVWQAGIALRYNISAIYQVPKKFKIGNTILDQTVQKELLTQQEVDVSVNNSFIKYREAREELNILTKNLKSAEENYRVVEKKYLNQLALLVDMTDAINIKIEAELRLTDASINVIFTYYQLLKTTGQL
jgi:outer membrane protein